MAGGGAIEMELSKYLRDYSRTIPGKQQLLIGAYAKALEIIPRQLCDNAGFDATNILNKLRARHAQVGYSSPPGPGTGWTGLDSECVLCLLKLCVVSPGDSAGTKPSTNCLPPLRSEGKTSAGTGGSRVCSVLLPRV